MARTVLSIAAAVLVFGLIGCSSSDFQPSVAQAPAAGSAEADTQLAALEAYADVERAQVDAFMQTSPGLYSEIVVEAVYPDSIAFTYTYATQVDPTAAASQFDVMTPTLQTLCDTAVFPAMKSAGVIGTMHVRYKYLNADGTEIWEKGFQSS